MHRFLILYFILFYSLFLFVYFSFLFYSNFLLIYLFNYKKDLLVRSTLSDLTELDEEEVRWWWYEDKRKACESGWYACDSSRKV
jgi:hypothetical protein